MKNNSSSRKKIRRVCFVTGTRAEFGLMRTTLQAIQSHPTLKLQIVVTGMHLDPRHGDGVAAVRSEGWKIDAIVPWERSSIASQSANARNTGQAMAELARCFQKLKSDIVLVVGDRVEAFAAAAAGHIGGQIVAHIHGGDRALGQVDDALRHAITKLAHVHFPATAASARRIARLGELRQCIHVVGSPGIDGIDKAAASVCEVYDEFADLRRRRYALLVLHPVDADDRLERRRAQMVLRAVGSIPFEHIVIIHPNNDPGCQGIIGCWNEAERQPRIRIRKNVRRSIFLGLLRDAAVLVGNSSSGIIEAASFGTPVVDIGPRQMGRQCSGNVIHAGYDPNAINRMLRRIWNGGRPRRSRAENVYGAGNAGAKISRVLAGLPGDGQLRRKLIAY